MLNLKTDVIWTSSLKSKITGALSGAMYRNYHLFTALHEMQTRSSDENSVCAVPLSVKRVHCDKTEERYV